MIDSFFNTAAKPFSGDAIDNFIAATKKAIEITPQMRMRDRLFESYRLKLQADYFKYTAKIFELSDDQLEKEYRMEFNHEPQRE